MTAPRYIPGALYDLAIEQRIIRMVSALRPLFPEFLPHFNARLGCYRRFDISDDDIKAFDTEAARREQLRRDAGAKSKFREIATRLAS